MRQLVHSEQGDCLALAARSADICKGEVCDADIQNVNLQPNGGLTEVRFCQAKIVNKDSLAHGIRARLTKKNVKTFIAGDSAIQGLEGLYTLKGARIHSNGKLLVTITDKTQIVSQENSPCIPNRVPAFVGA